MGDSGRWRGTGGMSVAPGDGPVGSRLRGNDGRGVGTTVVMRGRRLNNGRFGGHFVHMPIALGAVLAYVDGDGGGGGWRWGRRASINKQGTLPCPGRLLRRG